MRNFLFIVTTGISLSAIAHAQVTYKMSSDSGVRISGTSTVSDWTVTAQHVDGDMVFVPSSKKAGSAIQPGTIKSGKAVLVVADIKSEKGETMDNKMYNALKKDAHPEISFLLTHPVSIKGVGDVSVTGNVEIAGVTRPVTFDLKLTDADHAFHLQGSKAIKLSEFNIEPPTAMFGQIETGDEITVELDLLFIK